MNSLQRISKKALEYILPWLVLAVLLVFTYAAFFERPYGIWWSGDGIVSQVFVNEREPTIHVGDRLVKVGQVDFQTFQRDLTQDLFEGVNIGDVIAVIVQRGEQQLTVQWRVPGTSAAQLRDELFSQWFLAYFFWIAGTMTLLQLRPRDQRWSLLASFNFVTAIWLAAGSGMSGFHVWYGALIMRVAIWMSVPLYLHLHWVFPRPLGRLSAAFLCSIYGLGAALAAAQWAQLLPRSLYFLGFLLAVLGSLALLIVHAVRQPEMRRDLRLILIAAILAIVPSLVLAGFGALGGALTRVATLAMLSLPVLPFAYLYAAYRRQLGDLEIRVNRAVSIYAFLILLGTIVVPILVGIDQLPVYSPEQPLITSVIASIVVTTLSLWVYPIFQGFVESRILGISVPSKELQQAYSAHITSTNSFAGLTRLLNDEILPSLLVRQFAFLVMGKGNTWVLLRIGVDKEDIPIQNARTLLSGLTGKDIGGTLPNESKYAWIRLALPLQVQDEQLGFWLFGRRDPDDVYSSVEVPILQLFANQTAIALSNILQSQRLRAMYQADINRHENERLSLARDLHDSVLSELAGMLMNTQINTLPESFQRGYQALTQRLREIVSDLRPPMLNYGLKPAIEELADSLMERSQDTVSIVVDLDSTGDRYPTEKEQHLFRIVQEACENAARHSHGKTITVAGSLGADYVDLSVDDDGNGLRLGKGKIDLYTLVSERHFGLAGMLERAELIGADIRIISTPGSGTRILIRWRVKDLPHSGERASGELPA